jgi:23S rRNA-/tRNA-specific pseudouridylate synthase
MALLRRHRPELDLRLVHRLDQGTSGLLLLAKDAETAARVGKQWQGREIRKSYLANISKSMESCEIQKPIGRLRLATPARYACEGDLLDPKPSSTILRPATSEEIEGLEPGHWVVAEPHTGRTHQIRVHLAYLGSPVVGDGLYGGPPSTQMWLHAWKLELEHFTTGERLLLTAEPMRFRSPFSSAGAV